MQLMICTDGTIEFSGSPSELESFADMLRDAALYGKDQRGTLMGADGITPIVIVPQAADRALDVARRLAAAKTPSEPEAVAAFVVLRTLASDLMVFAGVDAEQADAAVREGTGEFRVHDPPSSPQAPFGLRRSTRR